MEKQSAVINGNKSTIIGMAQNGLLKIGDIVFSSVNNCKYRIEQVKNHQGEWIGVQEIE